MTRHCTNAVAAFAAMTKAVAVHDGEMTVAVRRRTDGAAVITSSSLPEAREAALRRAASSDEHRKAGLLAPGSFDPLCLPAIRSGNE